MALAHTDSEMSLYEKLADHGVSRRDFVKWCGSIAAMIGMSEAMAPQIAAAVESAAASKLAPAVWINGGACTGCTESIAQATYPNVAQIVLDILSLNYVETIMWAQGEAAEKAASETAAANQGKYILIYEGTVMEGFGGNALRVAGKPSLEIIDELAPKAAAIVAVGSCAVDGGWVKAAPNPASGTGISMYLKKKNIATPVVNLPTCPVNPEWIVAVVIEVLLLGELENGKILEKLDDQGRPKLIFGQTIHDLCPRRGQFENGNFVYEFGTQAEVDKACLYAMGCKGPQTYTNCPTVRWNDQTSWCVESGSPCIGCGNFNWVDQGAPFLSRFRKLDPAGANIAPTDIAWGVGAVAGAALVVHGIGTAAAGRRPNGAPEEAMKEHDRKKGGDK
jgi:hydrogenase small subunit